MSVWFLIKRLKNRGESGNNSEQLTDNSNTIVPLY